MKKGLFTLAAFMLLTLAAAAAPGVQAEQGDPKKEKEQKASFGLTEGYFSIFEIFRNVEKVDTVQKNIAPLVNKRSAISKK